MPRRSIADTDLLKKARERFKLGNEADAPQAQRERDDIRFSDGDQWPADVKLARMGQQPTAGLPAVPARPTLVIDKLKAPTQQILNQERDADIGVSVVPADDFGDLGITPDDTEIELREGLIRQIQRDSKASDARTWAYKRAVIAGRGFYLVNTRYLPGKTFDQEVYVERIFNQAGVILDPAHEQPDGSDAEWEFIGTWVPWDRYKAEHKKVLGKEGKLTENPYGDYSEGDFMGLTEDYPDWYKADGEQRAVRVVSYWYKEHESKTLCQLGDGTLAWKDEIGKDVEVASERVVLETTIHYCKIGGGVQLLEQTEWVGPDMPIIKVVGDEVLPYDNQRRVNGIVRSSRDSQMGFNYMVSKQVEMIGLTPIPPLMVDPEAIDGYEAWYASANTRALPYLPYRSKDDQGRELLAPSRPNVEPPILPVAQAINLFDQSIKSTTAIPDPTLGNVDPNLKSGRAIREVVANAQSSSSHYLDNLARSVRYEGQVLNNLLYPIYGQKPGRLVRIITGEGDPQMMAVGEPEQAEQRQAIQKRAQKVAKLTQDANFNVVVKVSKSFDSRRTELVTKLGELIAAAPDQMGVAGDILYKNMDIPEAKQLAERMRVMLAPPVQQMLAAKEQGQEFDPAAQAQIAELTKQLESLQQVATQLHEELKGKAHEQRTKLEIERMQGERDVRLETLKVQADLDKARLDAEAALEKARMDNATKIHVAEIAAKTKGVIQAHEAEHEAMSLALEQGHESEQAALDRENLERQAERQEAEAERSRQFEADEAERSRKAESAREDE